MGQDRFGTGYPTVTGSFQTTYAGGEGGSFACDVSISKFTADGTDLVYSTYLGGSKNELPHSLAVDSSGQLIVYGTTGSDDFPMGEDAYDNSFGGGDNATVTYVVQFSEGTDIYLTKFTADGTDIIGSTYLGGNENDGMNLGDIAFNYGDHARGEVVTNTAGDVYVASCTYSSNFPVLRVQPYPPYRVVRMVSWHISMQTSAVWYGPPIWEGLLMTERIPYAWHPTAPSLLEAQRTAMIFL